MIDAKRIYAGEIKSGCKFRIEGSNRSVFVTDFVPTSIDGQKMSAITAEREVIDISRLEICDTG